VPRSLGDEPGMTRHFYVQVAEDDFTDVAPPG
jgi:hypothetical protein